MNFRPTASWSFERSSIDCFVFFVSFVVNLCGWAVQMTEGCDRESAKAI